MLPSVDAVRSFRSSILDYPPATVRARVIVLDAYRRPWQQGSLDVFLYSPMGDEIHRWIARHARMGVVHVEYDLADAETIEGEWTIRAATR